MEQGTCQKIIIALKKSHNLVLGRSKWSEVLCQDFDTNLLIFQGFINPVYTNSSSLNGLIEFLVPANFILHFPPHPTSVWAVRGNEAVGVDSEAP